MKPDEKLRAIATLTYEDGLRGDEVHDIAMWCELAGPDFDVVNNLNDKSIERICSIHHHYFVE